MRKFESLEIQIECVFDALNGMKGILKSGMDKDGRIFVEIHCQNKTIFDYGSDQLSLWETFTKAMKDNFGEDYEEDFFRCLFFSKTNFIVPSAHLQ